VRTLAEALRLAPGVEVSRIAPARYAVGIRGFTNEFTTKLLVLQDGRYLYTPLFAGIFWDMHDTPLEDVERIEVVRGPGGTAWGVNAVNGVINIVTKSALRTRGWSAMIGGGNEERLLSSVRYGGGFPGDGAFRAFVGVNEHDAGVFADGADSRDGWRQARGGIRIDTHLSARDSVTLNGEVFDGDATQFTPFGNNADIDVKGGFALGRWVRTWGPQSELSAQMYYDDSTRKTFQGTADRSVWSVEVVNRTPLLRRHDLTVGASYRRDRNDERTIPGLTFDPQIRRLEYLAAFVDDAVRFFDERLIVSAGIKFEENDFTGVENLPNARAAFMPTDRQTFWAAYSRGARIPSIADNDSSSIVPGVASLANTELPAEELEAYEIGWRMRDPERWTLDVAAFRNRYDLLRTRETTMQPGLIVRTRGSKLNGASDGVEAALDWQLTRKIRMQAHVSYLDVKLNLEPGSTDMSAPDEVGVSPRRQASLRGAFRIADGVELNATYRYVDDLPALLVDSYHNLDVRLAWQANKRLLLVLCGQNLLNTQHREFRSAAFQPPGGDVERGGYLQLRWEQ
jgi:iron complex outermembrane receptor protein